MQSGSQLLGHSVAECHGVAKIDMHAVCSFAGILLPVDIYRELRADDQIDSRNCWFLGTRFARTIRTYKSD